MPAPGPAAASSLSISPSYLERALYRKVTLDSTRQLRPRELLGTRVLEGPVFFVRNSLSKERKNLNLFSWGFSWE